MAPFTLLTKSISGSKWIDCYESKLYVLSVIASAEIYSHLSQASGMVFVIDTNSVRITPAAEIVSHVREVISSFRPDHGHLNEPGKISISLAFPCGKTTNIFSSVDSMMCNIHPYNEQLISLSSEMNFNIIDFDISEDELAFNRLHVKSDRIRQFQENILAYTDHLIQSSSMTISASLDSEVESVDTATSSAGNLLNLRSELEKHWLVETRSFIWGRGSNNNLSKLREKYIVNGQSHKSKISWSVEPSIRVRFSNSEKRSPTSIQQQGWPGACWPSTCSWPVHVQRSIVFLCLSFICS